MYIEVIGPKSYSYTHYNCIQVVNSECTSKIKGFTLHQQNSQVYNHNTLRPIIDQDIHNAQIKYHKVVRNKQTKNVQNKHESKTLQLVR